MIEWSVGAIGAAIVAGLVSLLSLIISKEQKVSDFRQAWIDSLRAELVEFITKVNTLADLSQVRWNADEARRTAFLPVIEAINTATFSISLRLNPEEEKAQGVLRSMQQLSALVTGQSAVEDSGIRRAEKEFLEGSKEMLKVEWQRVKSGEPAFRLTKYLIVASIILSPLAITLLSR